MPDTPQTTSPPARIRFDRNELAGSFGDIGTDLPLLAAMIPAAGLDAASVFIVFGLAQAFSGILYGLPMPMQPLKAMAVLVISQQLGGDLLYGAGLAIGLIMLVLSVTGLLNWIARIVPPCVVRGVQLGLGLQLANLALGKYVPSSGLPGYVLAALCFLIGLALFRHRRVPAALPIIGVGLLYAVCFDLDLKAIAAGAGLSLPRTHVPLPADIWTGLFVLALPQLPLSISNSIIATHKTLGDLFPERPQALKKIGLTYSLVNLIVPFFSGIPVCHGCGGLAGHAAFGARTGGSVILYGALFIVIGLFFGGSAAHVIRIFPQPVLGIILLFEALVLMSFLRDTATDQRTFLIALLVATAAMTLPQGFAIGFVIGTLLYYLPARYTLAR